MYKTTQKWRNVVQEDDDEQRWKKKKMLTILQPKKKKKRKLNFWSHDHWKKRMTFSIYLLIYNLQLNGIHCQSSNKNKDLIIG